MFFNIRAFTNGTSNCNIEYLQCQNQIQIHIDQNQIFEEEFKICDSNKTKIVHRQSEQN
jgi:hypothetical protein